MITHSQTAEIRALLTVTSKKVPEQKRSLWLGQLNADMFHTPVCKQAFERIAAVAKKRFKIITFKALLEDARFDEDMRDVLNRTKEKPCAKKSQWEDTLHTLEEFRKIRTVQDGVFAALEQFDGNKVDIDEVIEELTLSITRANSSKQDDVFLLNFGKNGNNDDIIDAICRNETAPRITTGYTEYDKKNGGFPDNGVIILAGTTSGGKSTIAMNICRHMYFENNLSTLRVTLEMQELQETQRLMSHLTGIPLKRFSQAKLTEEDKRKVRRAKKRMDDHGKKHGITYTTHSPRGPMTMDDCLRIAKPFGYKVIVIDYVGLLDDESGDDQWKSLMDAARVAKNFTRETGTLVILLAQLDDEKEKLRYSKGMKEHADVLWQWNYTRPEHREMRMIPVDVSKDRDGELMRFELAERFDIMSAFNPDDAQKSSGGGNIEFEEDEKPASAKEQKKLKGKKTKKLSKDEAELVSKLTGKKKKRRKTELLGSFDGPPALS